MLTTTASNLSDIVAYISRQSANATAEAKSGAIGFPSSSFPPSRSMSRGRRSISQSATISTDLCFATSERSADPMPPQPTLAIRSLSLFQGWFLRRFKTELKANGAASDAATNDRREICIEHIEQENSLRRKRMCKILMAAAQLPPVECSHPSKLLRNRTIPRFAMRETNEFQLKLLEQIECEAAKYLSSSSGSPLAVSAGR